MKGTLDGIVDEIHGPMGNVGLNSINKFQSNVSEVHSLEEAEELFSITSPKPYNRPRRWCTTLTPEAPGIGRRVRKVNIKQVPPPAKHGPKRCPCEAFKVLDTYYTQHPLIRSKWRKAASGARLSPYDYFMKLNLKRMNLGINGISLPPKGGPFRDYYLTQGDIPCPELCEFNAFDNARWITLEPGPDTGYPAVFLDFYDPRDRNTTPGNIALWAASLGSFDYFEMLPWGPCYRGWKEFPEFIRTIRRVRLYWGLGDFQTYQRTMLEERDYFGPMHGKTRR